MHVLPTDLNENHDYSLEELMELDIIWDSVISGTVTYADRRINSVKTDSGVTYVKTFNKIGKTLAYKDSNGVCSTYTYNSVGSLLTYKSSTGGWCRHEYDSMNREVLYENNESLETTTYNDKGNATATIVKK